MQCPSLPPFPLFLLILCGWVRTVSFPPSILPQQVPERLTSFRLSHMTVQLFALSLRRSVATAARSGLLGM